MQESKIGSSTTTAQKEWKTVAKEFAKNYLRKNYGISDIARLLQKQYHSINLICFNQARHRVSEAKTELTNNDGFDNDIIIGCDTNDDTSSDNEINKETKCDIDDRNCGECNMRKDTVFWEVGCYFIGCMVPDPFDNDKMYCKQHWTTKFVNNSSIGIYQNAHLSLLRVLFDGLKIPIIIVLKYCINIDKNWLHDIP